MTSFNFARRRALMGGAVLLATLVGAAATPRAYAISQLSGYTYIDRNNDGLLAFSDQAQPEWVLSGIEVKLFSVTGTTETLLSTTLSDAIGQYMFSNLAAGAYAIRQTQPVQYVDGRDAIGVIRSSGGQVDPPGSNVGTVAADAFTGIVLPDNARGDLYNFGELGLAPAYVSKRYLLGTAPPPVFTPAPDLDTLSVPEPSTVGMAVVAALGLLGRRRSLRRRRHALAQA